MTTYSKHDRYAKRDMLAEVVERIVVLDDCWEWAGQRDRRGYGRFDFRSEHAQAHRLVYELFVGPVPHGLVLDHLCRNPPCVNPDHLEPVDNRENILRGTAPTALNAVKTECKWGHPLEGDNLLLRPDGRECRTCARANGRASRLRRRLADESPGVRWHVERVAEPIEPGIHGDLLAIPVSEFAALVEQWRTS